MNVEVNGLPNDIFWCCCWQLGEYRIFTTLCDSTPMIWHFLSAVSKNRTSKRHSLRGVCWLSEFVAFRSIVLINKIQSNQNDFSGSIGCGQNCGRIPKEWIQFWKLSSVSLDRGSHENISPEIALSYRLNGNVTSTANHLNNWLFLFLHGRNDLAMKWWQTMVSLPRNRLKREPQLWESFTRMASFLALIREPPKVQSLPIKIARKFISWPRTCSKFPMSKFMLVSFIL